MHREPNERELAFLFNLARDSAGRDIRPLLIEDLAWGASRLGTEFNEYALRAAVLGLPPFAHSGSLLEMLSHMKAKRKTDVLLITVKGVELQAVKSALRISPKEPGEEGPRGSRLWRSKIGVQSTEGQLDVLVAMAGEAKNYKMSSFMHTLLSGLQPSMCVLVGMAAGRRGKVILGDVVVAREIVDYSSSVLAKEGAIPDPETFRPDVGHIRPMDHYEPLLDDWRDEVRDLLKGRVGDVDVPVLPSRLLKDIDAYNPSLKVGAIFSGDILMEDGSFELRAKSLLTRDSMAAEMEGAGFACICAEAQLPWLVIRGVADHGEPRRSKDWQYASTVAAAAALRRALATGFLKPVPHA